jgi:hypothetical protein
MANLRVCLPVCNTYLGFRPVPGSCRNWFRLRRLAGFTGFGGDVDEGTQAIRLMDEQRIEWLRLIRSQNVGRARFAP